MKMEWMGRYRELIDLLKKYINLFSPFINKSVIEKRLKLTTQQWQTFECILEYEDENKNMVYMADRMGIKKSAFTKFVKVLLNYGLVERYQQKSNRKNILLKATEKGRIYYKDCSQIILESVWKEPFAALDKLSDENLAIVIDFFTKIVDELDPKNNKVEDLFKLL